MAPRLPPGDPAGVGGPEPLALPPAELAGEYRLGPAAWHQRLPRPDVPGMRAAAAPVAAAEPGARWHRHHVPRAGRVRLVPALRNVHRPRVRPPRPGRDTRAVDSPPQQRP